LGVLSHNNKTFLRRPSFRKTLSHQFPRKTKLANRPKKRLWTNWKQKENNLLKKSKSDHNRPQDNPQAMVTFAILSLAFVLALAVFMLVFCEEWESEVVTAAVNSNKTKEES
jgi:hypothetical protein